jgi:hypothetical protein
MFSYVPVPAHSPDGRALYGGLVGGCNKIVFLIFLCVQVRGFTKERSLKRSSWMLLMLGWVGGKAKSSREPLLNKEDKRERKNRTAQKKEIMDLSPAAAREGWHNHQRRLWPMRRVQPVVGVDGPFDDIDDDDDDLDDNEGFTAKVSAKLCQRNHRFSPPDGTTVPLTPDRDQEALYPHQ